MIKKQITKKGSKVWYLESKLTFGKHEGSTIRELLEYKDTRSYVTEFMIGKLGMFVIGVDKVRYKSDSCYGVDTGKGLTPNHSFYRDYITSKAITGGVRIACKVTGVIVDGNSIEEVEDRLNIILNDAYGQF